MKSTLVRMTYGLIACLALAAVPVTAHAGFVYDQEPNDTFATPQVIPSSAYTLDYALGIGTGGGSAFQNTSTTIPHVTILRPGTDQTTTNFDYFQFTTYGTGTVVLDITNAPAPSGVNPVVTNFDTYLSLFTSSGLLLATNDNKGPDGLVPTDLQNGALVGGQLNSHIEESLPAGTYIVAVSESPSMATDGGVLFTQNPIGGAYTLNISGDATPGAPTPEPATWILMGLGMFGMFGYRKWHRPKMSQAAETKLREQLLAPRFTESLGSTENAKPFRDQSIKEIEETVNR